MVGGEQRAEGSTGTTFPGQARYKKLGSLPASVPGYPEPAILRGGAAKAGAGSAPPEGSAIGRGTGEDALPKAAIAAALASGNWTLVQSSAVSKPSSNPRRRKFESLCSK